MPRSASFVGPGPVDVTLEVNGERATLHVPPHRTLLDALRAELGLTGAKKACDEGTCGACTVLVDGRAVYSCMTLAVACAARSVETVEGLSSNGRLHPLQQAFIDKDAYQCGFCTPGQLMSLVALLRSADPAWASDQRRSALTEDDVRRAVTGNLCRCGAYAGIVAAGLAAARKDGARKKAASAARRGRA